MWYSHQLNATSFQCPTEYQDEMGRDVERLPGEQNVLPTKRDLVKLHKKVIIIIFILGL